MILGSVLAALKTKFAALPVLTGVEVYVGMPVTSDDPQDLVLLSHDGEWDSDAQPTVEYEWANIAGTSRYETGNIPCALISQSGDDDMQARFDRVQVLLAAMENALVTDMNSGVALGGLVMGCTITSGQARQIQNEAGAAVLAPFVLTYRAQV
jgi:hypothetical protein